MALARSFTIKTGSVTSQIPAVGLGTWQSEPGEVKRAVAHAIKTGYRHIDGAPIYGNEKEVGQGIKEGLQAAGIKRDDLFITSKLWNSHHQPEYVEKGLDQTLQDLQLDYLNLFLCHWPVAYNKQEGKIKSTPKNAKGELDIDHELTKDFEPTWRAMEKLVESGKVRHIGVSNFNIRRCKELLGYAKIKPVINQVELSIINPQPDLLAWSKQNNILLEAYSPFGSAGAPLLSNKVVTEIAKKNNTDTGVVLISHAIQRGLVVLPKSVTPKRIEHNFKDIDLSKEDFQALEQEVQSIIERGEAKRAVDFSSLAGFDIFEDKSSENSDKAQAHL